MEIERLELSTKMFKTIFIAYNIDIIRIKNILRIPKLNDHAILHFEYDNFS
jgi:fructose-1,6-bisphosphatase